MYYTETKTNIQVTLSVPFLNLPRITSASPVTTMTWPELCEKLLTRLEAQGENMSTERAEFGVLMVDCAMRGCGADPGMKGDGSNGD